VTLENALQDFLLKDILISRGPKKIKTGKVMLYTVRDHYIYFTLIYNGLNKKFELPRPFRFKYNKNHIVLDYTLEELGGHNERKINSIHTIAEKHSVTANRYFNNIVILSALN
jgi:hypothetical protein